MYCNYQFNCMTNLIRCAICPLEGAFKCGSCCARFYCSLNHQNTDWKHHKSTCFPFAIRKNQRDCYNVVATRDIKAGEIIIKEKALYLAPQKTTIPVCVVCFEEVDLSYLCPNCSWPLCGPICQESVNHIAECSLSNSEGGFKITDLQEKTEFLYQFIAPLKLLWIRETNREKFATILAHSYERLRSLHKRKWAPLSLHMARWLEIDDFDDTEIIDAFEIAKSKAIDIPITRKAGFYEITSLLSISCTENVFVSFNINEEIVVKASIDIPKHNRFCLSYYKPFIGSHERRKEKTKMLYDCYCARCNDPTDMGTHLSSILCKTCKTGRLLPPLLEKSNWICQSCKAQRSVASVDTMLNWYESKINEAKNDQFMVLDALFDETEIELTENHYLRLRLKQKLSAVNSSEDLLYCGKISNYHVNLKIGYCKDILQVLDELKIGYSELRGKIANILAFIQMNVYISIKDGEDERKNVKNLHERISLLKELKPLIITVLKVFLEDSISPAVVHVVKDAKTYLRIVKQDLQKLLPLEENLSETDNY